ncbi:hypothetical protein Droror1_Dr00003580 [Drosera rotundifolia]
MKNKNQKRFKFSKQHQQKNNKAQKKKDEFFDDGTGDEYSDDDVIDSDEENGGKRRRVGVEEEEEDKFEKETADERRIRLAKQYIDGVKSSIKRRKEEEGDEDEEGEEEEEDDERESIVAKILEKRHLEESGRTRRLIASKVQRPDSEEPASVLVKHRQSVTAVAVSHDDMKGFSASKDGTIVHWDVDSGKTEKYIWPSEDVLKSHGVKDPQGQVTNHSKQVLALAVTSDGRYLATGGLDRHVHLWDVRTREHIQAFPGHRGAVSCLSFRWGTSELYSGSFDRSIKIWNAEDRAFIAPLFGHQSEVLTIDCLRKERALTVGRDRTMQLYKVPEESHIVFRASGSLECGCFVSDDTFLSGSNDGGIQLWSILKKKPVFIVKNVHPLVPTKDKGTNSETLRNGHHDPIENKSFNADSACSTAQSWVGSVAVCPNSDLAASGAGNGLIGVWAIENENRSMKSLFQIPTTGFVNSLAFARSGRFLVAGIGQEPRLGRWGRIPSVRNGVVLHSFKLS